MRISGRFAAFLLLGAAAVSSWMSGCSDLENDCELLVNCPETKPAPVCNGTMISLQCDPCIQEHCCQEISDCYDDMTCEYYCMFGTVPSDPLCSQGKTGTAFEALKSCLATNCSTECAAKSYCNPVNGTAGCPPPMSPTVSCEMAFPGIFVCYDMGLPPAALCQPCNLYTGPLCDDGLRCDPKSNLCARYCCNDTDCGTGHCELDQNIALGYSTANPADMVGICMATAPATGPACDAAALPAPSGGMCVPTSAVP